MFMPLNYEMSPYTIRLLTATVRQELNLTLNKIKDRICNKGAKVSVYFDTCFLMRDYFKHVYMIIKRFVDENDFAEGDLEFVFLDQVETELHTLAGSNNKSSALCAQRAIEDLIYDKETGHLFSYKKISDKRHHDTVLLQEIIGARQGRDVIVLTNDYCLSNDLLMINYFSSTHGHSVTTIYISADATEYKYSYHKANRAYFNSLANDMYLAWSNNHENQMRKMEECI